MSTRTTAHYFLLIPSYGLDLWYWFDIDLCVEHVDESLYNRAESGGFLAASTFTRPEIPDVSPFALIDSAIRCAGFACRPVFPWVPVLTMFFKPLMCVVIQMHYKGRSCVCVCYLCCSSRSGAVMLLVGHAPSSNRVFSTSFLTGKSVYT